MKNENKSFLINEIWTLINFFLRSTSTSRQMNLQNQKKWTWRNSALQNAMSDSWFRTDRKTELYEDFRLDDQINEL
jgi:hypothetical protein